MRILLVEDEPTAARMLAKGLREHTYAVDVAADGETALFQVGTTDYDAVILDVMLPAADGFTVCRSIRESGSAVPILMLTARDAVDARIEGLDCGADDYLVKPYNFGELLARLRAVMRRGSQPMPPAQVQGVRSNVLGVPSSDRCLQRGKGGRPQRADVGVRDLVVDREYFLQRSVVPLGPEELPVVGGRLLRRDPEPLARFAHRPLQHGRCAKQGADRAYVLRLPLEREYRRPR